MPKGGWGWRRGWLWSLSHSLTSLFLLRVGTAYHTSCFSASPCSLLFALCSVLSAGKTEHKHHNAGPEAGLTWLAGKMAGWLTTSPKKHIVHEHFVRAVVANGVRGRGEAEAEAEAEAGRSRGR